MGSTNVSIIEVGPRDGLQSEPEILSTQTKLEFINRAIDAGIRRMEVTSFVHPKRVPQMADAEDVVRGLPQRDDFTAIGLVLNKRGFERARQRVGTIGTAGFGGDVGGHKRIARTGDAGHQNLRWRLADQPGF